MHQLVEGWCVFSRSVMMSLLHILSRAVGSNYHSALTKVLVSALDVRVIHTAAGS